MDSEQIRLERLVDAEQKAFALLALIETSGIVAAGRTEREVEQDIYALAQREFGVEKHWHKRIARAGINTLCVAADNPPVRMIEADDIVYLDLGPVFEEWEADVGRSYAIGADPRKHALCRELPIQFDKVRERFLRDPEISGTALYDYACQSAEEVGWRFGGRIAGHVVGEFPHARMPGPKERNRIAPSNPEPLRALDLEGRQRYWILEIHLVDREEAFGGFYERLLLDHP
ncbi:MAG: M24 family metallopeptidase [Candidatus Sphingomonas colombiensis]|nr:M24 family metallopeptidase [Sphingomonas sp.]WEK42262.1 MAG: M24 family metallopeptidase [Sphingomonas sp.]